MSAALRAATLALLAALAVGPIVVLLIGSLAGSWFWPELLPARWDDSAWRSVGSGSGRLARATLASIVLALGTGALATALAVPVGRALAGLRGGWRAVGAGAAFLPVAAPPIALAVGLQLSMLRLGLGASLPGVLLAHLVPAVGYGALFFLGIFAVWDARVEDEARTLGATRRQVLRRVTLPLLRRPLAECFVLGFLVSWAQVPLTLLVGQGVIVTLSVEVLTLVQAGQDRLAAAGALLLVVPPLLLMLAARFAIGRAGAVAP